MFRILAAVLFVALVSGAAWAQDVTTIAVVRDGPIMTGTNVDDIEEQVRLLAGPDRPVVFKKSSAFDAGWDATRATPVVQAALADPEVDILLTTGAMVSLAASSLDLSKPVVSSWVLALDQFRIAEMEGDRSKKPNFSFMLVPNRYETDARAFQEMIPFDKALVVIGTAYTENFEGVDRDLAEFGRNLDIDLKVLPVSDNIAQSLDAIDPDINVAILWATPGLDEATRRALILQLNDRGIATFSLLSHHDVSLGALASRVPDLGQQSVRRTALNLNELIRGGSTGDLPILLEIDTTLLINGRTAATIGYAPDFLTQSFARILHPEAISALETPLDLSEALRLAEQGNASLGASTQETITAEKTKDVARSPLLPNLRFRPAYVAIDAGANGLGGAIPDQQITLGGSLEQMIYDDRRISEFRSTGRLAESQAARTEAERLDVYQDASDAFLRLVLTRIFYAIQVENLRLTETNRELAQVRLEVGYSGRDEVYRWEAEVAKRRSELLETQALVQIRQIELNQVFGMDQATRWNTEEIEVDSDVFPFVDGQLNFAFQDRLTFEKFRNAVINLALVNAPELESIYKGMEAQEIQLNQRKRRWFLPAFLLSANYDYRVYQDPEIVDLERGIPRMAITADYPIFDGTRRSNEIGQASSELLRLSHEQRLVHQNVERRARSAIQQMENTFPTIRLGEIQAENALKNFVLVQDKYTQGLVNITDLLSAQNESFVANQAQAATTYTFLLDMVGFQRSISWFEDVKTAAEQEEFLRILEEMMTSDEEQQQ
jgi:outer membrane protein TolC